MKTPGICMLAALCLLGQTPGAGPERAAALLDEAQKLADQHTGAMMQQAIAKYREAAQIGRDLHDPKIEAKAVEQIGVLSIRMGNLQPALDNLNAALHLFQTMGDRKEEQVTLNNIGLVQSRMGNQRLAIETQQRALALAREIGDREEEAIVLNNLGLAYHELGEEAHAIEEFEKAAQMHHDLGNDANEGAAWSNLGAIHYTQGDLQKSLEAFERALALRRQAKDRRGEAITLGRIAVLRHAFGEDQEALAAFDKALELDREAGDHHEESMVTMNMGNVFMTEARYKEAVECFDRAMQLQEKWGKTKDWANQQSSKAVALTDLGKYDEAEKAFAVALEAHRAMENKRGESETLEHRAVLFLRLGRPEDGARDAAEAARISEAIGEKRSRSEALYQLARCRKALGQPKEALAAIDEAVRLSETIRGGVSDYDLRASYFARVRDQYDLKVALLVESDDLPAALETAEASRARSLNDLIGNHLPAGHQAETGKVAAGDLQRELDAGTVALEYSLGPESSYAFVVTADRVSVRKIDPRARIEAAARRLYAKWSARQDSPEECAAVSRLVLAPVIADLKEKRVVIVPDGALAYIPFEALYASAGRRWIEDREIVSVVSLSTLKLMRERTRERAPARGLVAVFADPVFSRDDPRVHAGGQAAAASASPSDLTRSASDVGLAHLDRLVSTRREAAAIAALEPPKLRWQALDFDASLTAVRDAKLGDYRIVHFATHGLMNSRDPRLSGLVLSLVDREGRPHEGFLRADEVANLNLGADLVVLSACQTALGKELRGEGLLGLARSFMYAGAPRVVASLWRVADAATTDLMSAFYEGLLRSHLPAYRALRLAKLRLLRDPLHSNPYYWAGFALQGDWR